MLNADWLGAPRLRTLRTFGARGIKTWHAFGAPSHFLKKNKNFMIGCFQLFETSDKAKN